MNCAMGGVTWFGGFQDDKQNKQPFLIIDSSIALYFALFS
jgi:hypothetical protein